MLRLPLGANFRILVITLPLWSASVATNTFPCPSIAMPTQSSPADAPANFVTAPSGENLKIVDGFAPSKYKLPAGSNARPAAAIAFDAMLIVSRRIKTYLPLTHGYYYRVLCP